MPIGTTAQMNGRGTAEIATGSLSLCEGRFSLLPLSFPPAVVRIKRRGWAPAALRGVIHIENNTRVVPIQFHRNEWTVIIHSSATVIQFSIQQFFKRTYALNKWAPLPMGNISRTESKRRNSFVNHGHDHSDSCVLDRGARASPGDGRGDL